MTGDRPYQPPRDPRGRDARDGRRTPPPPPHAPPPGRVPPRRGAPPPSPPEGTQVIRRDGRAGGPPPPPPQQAWSQAPPPRYAPNPDRPGPADPYRTPPRRDQPYRRPEPPRERPYRRTPDDYRRPPPAAPPAPPAPPRPRRRPRWGRRLGVLALALAVVLVGTVVYLDRSLNRIDALADYPDRIGDTPGTNWLLVGSDSRAGLTPEQEAALATGGETGPDRTDTIIVIHVPSSGGPTTMVSLPRDSYVSIPGYGQDKINASFAIGGPQLLVQTVEQATGLHIDHYAEIGFGGFAGMVDAVGGVEMCLEQPIVDPLAGIDLPAGCQKLDGPQALGFVRTRATALADIDRMNNQRMFMSALLSKATSPTTLLNPFRMFPLAFDTVASLKVDQGDHIWHLARLAWAMRGEVVTTTVPIGGFTDNGSGNVVLWDRERAIEFFDTLADDRPLPPELITTGQ
ncbi:LCP family protein [Rhodococcus triatomae]|uniref:LCP family protein n=1 Tax=Rhodococcus triatomae TaxID=300028 RepID=UPI001FE567C6|nr:LCP family protein [Rhodococcus triatomae]